MALSAFKCQSNDVLGIRDDGGGKITVTGTEGHLTYEPRRITLHDGTVIAHESQGGDLSSVWATDLGDCYVEVVYVGDGPHGGELVLVVPAEDVLIVGDLYPGDPSSGVALENVPPTWPGAVDLAMGLTATTTTVLTSHGMITREEFDDSHQRLLGAVNG